MFLYLVAGVRNMQTALVCCVVVVRQGVPRSTSALDDAVALERRAPQFL